jgi:hypothetical protein
MNDRGRKTQLRVRWSWISAQLFNWVLPVYFAAHSAAMGAYFISHGLVGVDGRIYAAAATAWLAGQDPWDAAVQGFRFAAPPPTLVPFVPFALLGQDISGVFWVAASVIAAAAIIHQLKLSWWWVLFPPLANGILAGNADVLIVALVLTRVPLAGALASFLKIYALLPIAAERNWRALLTAGLLLMVSAPLLPWATYLAQSEQILATLDRQAIGISAYGIVWLMAGVSLGLLRVGVMRGGWLAVPALWPSTQLHYSTLALPALARGHASRTAVFVAGFLLAPEVPWLPALAVLVLAIDAILQRLRWHKPAT